MPKLTMLDTEKQSRNLSQGSGFPNQMKTISDQHQQGNDTASIETEAKASFQPQSLS
uniref:Uncharacterized protein n=1 Tax=Arion vulgaris TaxID=1028688 RepID=A0A0B6ZRF9_9EUPU